MTGATEDGDAVLSAVWCLDGDLETFLAEVRGHEHEWLCEIGVCRKEVPAEAILPGGAKGRSGRGAYGTGMPLGVLASISHLIEGDVVYRAGRPEAFYGRLQAPSAPQTPSGAPAAPEDAPGGRAAQGGAKAAPRKPPVQELTLDLGAHGLDGAPSAGDEEVASDAEESAALELESRAARGPTRPRATHDRSQQAPIPNRGIVGSTHHGDPRNEYFWWYLVCPYTGRVQARGWETKKISVRTPDQRFYEEHLELVRAPERRDCCPLMPRRDREPGEEG